MIEEIKEYEKPKYNIRVKTGERHLWGLFHPHHYMSDSLASGAVFFTFYLYEDGIETLFGCLGVIPQIAKMPARRLTRLVILPEFQGLGLAKHMINHIGEYYHSKGIRLYSATFHPRLGAYRAKSDLWQPSTNNLKEHSNNNNFFEENAQHTGLRDGVAMHRYFYDSANVEDIPKYKLLYDPLELAALKTERKANPSELINKLILEKEHQIKDLQDRINGDDKTLATEHELEETKKKMQKMFQRPKRKRLTPEERKQLKEEHAKDKNKT